MGIGDNVQGYGKPGGGSRQATLQILPAYCFEDRVRSDNDWLQEMVHVLSDTRFSAFCYIARFILSEQTEKAFFATNLKNGRAAGQLSTLPTDIKSNPDEDQKCPVIGMATIQNRPFVVRSVSELAWAPFAGFFEDFAATAKMSGIAVPLHGSAATRFAVMVALGEQGDGDTVDAAEVEAVYRLGLLAHSMAVAKLPAVVEFVRNFRALSPVYVDLIRMTISGLTQKQILSSLEPRFLAEEGIVVDTAWRLRNMAARIARRFGYSSLNMLGLKAMQAGMLPNELFQKYETRGGPRQPRTGAAPMLSRIDPTAKTR